MLSVEVQVSTAGLTEVRDKVRGVIGNALKYIAMDLETKLKEKSPVDTGRLRADWRSEPRGDTEWVVGNSVSYINAVITGRGPGPAPFAPIAAWARRHGLPEVPVWRAIMAHGTKANPFVDEALAAVSNDIPALVMRAVDEGT